jgi:hypothetical protein
VTVPDPYPIVGKPFAVQIGAHKVEFHPDASGISVSDEGMLVVKNTSLFGNGAVTGGTLNFDLTLKGAAVRGELEQAHVIEKDTLTSKPNVRLELTVGTAHHTGAADLKLLPQ